MRYMGYALTACGALAIGYFQLTGAPAPAEAVHLPMLFAGAALTMGLLLLVVSDDATLAR